MVAQLADQFTHDPKFKGSKPTTADTSRFLQGAPVDKREYIDCSLARPTGLVFLVEAGPGPRPRT